MAAFTCRVLVSRHGPFPERASLLACNADTPSRRRNVAIEPPACVVWDDSSAASAGGRIVFPPTSLHYREQARRLRAEGVVVKAGRVSREAILDLESF